MQLECRQLRRINKTKRVEERWCGASNSSFFKQNSDSNTSEKKRNRTE